MFPTRIAILVLACMFAGLAQAQSLTWSGPANGDWSNAANWTPHQIPGSGDAAIINSGASLFISSATAANGIGIDMGTGSVALNSGATLLLNGTLQGAGGSLTIGGTLNCGAGNGATVTSVLDIPTTIGVGGVLSLDSGPSGAGTLLLQDNVTCNGTLNYRARDTSGNTNSIDIAPGKTLTINGALNVTTDSGTNSNSSAAITDTGTLLIAFGGTLTSTSGIVSPNNITNPTVTNSGTIHVTGGALSISKGSSTGTLSVDTAATLTLPGNFTNSGALTTAGTGVINLTGTLTESTAVTLNGTMLLTGAGKLAGNGPLTVNGAIECGGQFGGGNGTINTPTTIASGAALTVDTGASGGAQLFIKSNVTCNGTLTYHSHTATSSQDFIDIASGFSLTVNGVFNMTTDAGSNAVCKFTNTGTLAIGALGVMNSSDSVATVHVVNTNIANAGNINVVNGTLSLANGGNNSGTISVSSGQIFDVSVTSGLINSGTLATAGSGLITINGTLQQDVPESFGGTMFLNGTLSGNGPWTLNGTLNCGNAFGAGGNAVIAIPTTISNGAILNLDTGTNGSASLFIQADVTCDGTLKFHTDNTSNFSPGIDIANGFTLTINSAFNMINDPGTVEAQSITGSGTLAIGAAGVLTSTDGSAVATQFNTVSAQISNAGAINVTKGTFSLNGGGANTGTITVSSGQTLILGGFSTVTNTGTIDFTGATLAVQTSLTNSGPLINTASSTLSLTGGLTQNGALAVNGTTILDATIDGTGPLTINGAMNVGSAFGSMNASANNPTLNLPTTIASSGSLNLDSGANPGGGSALLFIVADVTCDGPFTYRARDTTGNTSLLAISNGTTLTINNTFTMTTDATANAGSLAMISDSGTLSIGSGGTFSSDNLEASPNNVHAVTVAIVNAGNVVSAHGVLNLQNTFQQTAGALTLTGGDLDSVTNNATPTPLAIQGGQFGTGGGDNATITGDVNNSGGILQVSPVQTVRPYSFGTLNIIGSYTQGAGASYHTKIGGTAAGQFDQVIISQTNPLVGKATLDGTAQVALNDFAPLTTDNFTVMTYQTLSGTIATHTTVPAVNTDSLLVSATNIVYNCSDYGNAVPTLASISPNTGALNGAGFQMTLTGTGFLATSVVKWSGQPDLTTLDTQTATQIQVTIPSSYLTTPGMPNVAVFTPAPGGGTSLSQTFSISNPVPTIGSINPTTVNANGPSFSVTVTGTNFVGGGVSQFFVNGVQDFSTFVNGTTITGSVHSTEIANPGTLNITIVNSAPGGGTSNTATLTVVNPTPVLTSIDPTSVTAGTGAFTLTLTGSSFLPTSAVNFPGQADLAPVTQSATQITVSVPAAYIASGGLQNITVTNPPQGGGTSSAQVLTVNNPLPVLTSITPTPVTAGSGAFTLTLNGSNFVPTSTVTWTGQAALPVATFSATQITVSVPAGYVQDGGTPSIAVVNPTPGGGTSASQTLTVNNPLPVLTSLSPLNVVAGSTGLVLTLNGSNFVPSSVLNWSGQADLPVTTFSATQITVNVPNSYIADGAVKNITVTNPAPAGGTSAAQVFTVNNPVPILSTFNPNVVTAGSGGFTLTLSGASFVPSSVVNWQGQPDLPVTFVNSGQITASVPASYVVDGGTFNITVTNPAPSGGTSQSFVFTVQNPAPVLTSISPTSVIAGSGAFLLTLTGSNFVPSSVVIFQNQANLVPASETPTQITVNVPAGYINDGGTPNISVFNPTPVGGASTSQVLTVNNATPTLTGISPTTANAGDPGFTMTLNGANFVPSSTVTWQGQAALPVATFTTTQITVAVPASYVTAAGTPNVNVFNPAPNGGTSAAQIFTITNAAPTLTSIAPSAVVANSGAFTLTVDGTGYASGVSVVNVNGSPRVTTFVSNTELTAAIPAADIAAVGSLNITVVNPAPGGGASAPATLSINNPAPVVSTISPNSAFAGVTGFGNLTVNGSGFLASSVVQWQGQPDLTTLVSQSDTQIVVAVPDSYLTAAGTPNIDVVNPAPGGGTSATAPFTITNALPTITSINPTSVVVNSGGFSLTVNGTGFAAVTSGNVNGSSRVTAVISNTQLTVQVLATDINAVGLVNITATNPLPGGGTSTAATLTVNNPAPSLTMLSPNTAFVGTTGFGNITLTGGNFVSNSVVNWSGQADLTTLISQTPTQIVVAVPDSYLAAVGTPNVSVTNPGPGGGASGALPFTLTYPLPTATSINPTSVVAGSTAFSLVVNGTGFVNGFSTVNANGAARVTTFVNNTQLSAALLDADIATAGTVNITVANPAPGGGESSPALTLAVNNPIPTLNAPNPNSAIAGVTGFGNVTLTGSGFTASSVVQWSGQADLTTFVSQTATQIVVTVPDSYLAVAGTATITVVDPAPGGGSSAGQVFTINNPAPTLASLSPNSAFAGTTGFGNMTLTGTNFTATSVVQWLGQADLNPPFLSQTATSIVVVVPDSYLATAASPSVAVFNPAPGGGSSGAQTFTITNALPVIVNISPTSTVVNGGPFTLFVNGTGFDSVSVVNVDGSARPTTFVSNTQLTAAIPGSDLAAQGTLNITVVNPAPGGGTSTPPAQLNVILNNPVPTLSALSPNSGFAGTTGFGTLTLTGTGFTGSSIVQWSGQPDLTALVSQTSTQIVVTVPDSYLAAVGTPDIGVFNPTPGGGTSGTLPFTITYALPAITSLNPSSVVVNSGAFTLTVNGTGFVSGFSVVNVNGTPVATTFVSNTQLTAPILASDVSTVGSVSITVTNPAPGGGTSAPSALTVGNPAPTLTTLSPNSAFAGSTGFGNLTLSGTGFLPTSVVQWQGQADLNPPFVSQTDTQIVVAVPDSYLALVGTPNVTVVNPAPGGGPSNAATFTITYALPTITGLNPNVVLLNSGAFTLTVNGTGFASGFSVVNVNGAARVTTFVSNTQLTAAILGTDINSAGPVNITVTNPPPGGGTSVAAVLTVNNPAPTLSSLSPNSGLAGTTGFGNVTLTGTGFLPTSVVEWAGQADLTTFVSQTDTQIVVAVPDSYLASAGMANVVVFNQAPGGGASAAQVFTVNNPAPGLSSISPTSANAGDPGFVLTLNGSNFVPTSVVNWPNQPDLSLATFSASQITVNVPAGYLASGGALNITVTNPAPGGGASPAQVFTVTNPAPVLSSISPTTVTAGSGAFTLTLNGSGFVPSSLVNWPGQADLPVATFGAAQITVSVPASYIADGGTPGITVTNAAPGGGVSTSQTITVNNPVPTLASISPTSASAGDAGFTLTLNGANFVPSSTVNWTNQAALPVATFTATQITVSVPAGYIALVGSSDVSVANPAPAGGTSGTLPFAINNPAPVLTSISPTSVTAGSGGFVLTLNGSGFVAAATINFSGQADLTPATFSATQITVNVPAAYIVDGGTPAVTVTNPVPGGGVSSVQTLTVNNPVPVLSSISPASATAGGSGFVLTLDGSSFVPSSVVNWPGQADLALASFTATEVTVNVPAAYIASGGLQNVTVTNPAPAGGKSAAQVFTVNNPAPVLSSISPSSAAAGSGAFTLTLNGSGFVASSAVNWQGQADLTPLTETPTLITVNVPAAYIAAIGTANVTVTNPAPAGGTSAAQTFTINPPAPVIGSATTASGTAGTAFTYTITASNTPTAFDATGLPAGLSIDKSTGIISGTPSAAATTTVTLSATNATGTGTASLVLTITPAAAPAPVISSATTATATVGSSFSYTIAASNTPTSFNATNLPAGLSVDTGSGTISGIPTASGTVNVAISATNASGTGTATLVLTVNPSATPPVAPAITSTLNATATVNTAFTYTITASGTAPIVFAAANLPAGLTLTGSVISGSPTVSGAATVTLTATNAAGSDSEALVIAINGGPTGTPVITSPPVTPEPVIAGDIVTLTAGATDPNNSLLTFTWDFGDGTTAVGATVSHFYTTPGIYPVTVTVSNGSASASSTVNVAVNPKVGGPAVPPFIELKTAIKISFVKSGADSMALMGTLPLGQGTTFTGISVTVAVDKVLSKFTLDVHGKGTDKVTNASIRLSGKAKKGVITVGPVKFLYSLKKGTFTTQLADLGFTNANIGKPGIKVAVPILISFNGTTYGATPMVTYLAKAGKTGSAK